MIDCRAFITRFQNHIELDSFFPILKGRQTILESLSLKVRIANRDHLLRALCQMLARLFKKKKKKEDAPPPPPPEPYSSDGWFEHLFGFTESVQAVQENFTVKYGENQTELISKANGAKYNAGFFTLRTTASFPHLTPVGGGVFNLIQGSGGYGPKPYLSDVLAAQSFEDFDGATFLGASNFNCLEFVGPRQTARDGVSCYSQDQTQGPYLALAAGAATVYRNYFMKHADGRIGQLEEEVHLLRETPLDQFVTHGYPTIRTPDLEKLRDFDWDDTTKFFIGVHENCEVTTTRDVLSFIDAPKGRITHQIYAAAFNYGGVVECKETLDIGEKLLAAEYQATVKAAWDLSLRYPGRKGSKKLFLTFLGGGVFANPKARICAAIRTCKDLIIQSGLEVYLVCFDGYSCTEALTYLKDLMDETGGRVITED
jgi:hypothetical protein